jgi:hypothetical protein
MTSTSGPPSGLAAAARHMLDVLTRTPYVPREIAEAARGLKFSLGGSSGAELAERRQKAGISQPALGRCWINKAHPLGVSKAYVGRVERQPAPTPTTQAAYLAALIKADEIGEANR